MVGVDTNILVRFLTADDEDQYQLALKFLMEHDEVFVPKTVLLELEWVLRAAYSIHKTEIASIFTDLLSMEHLVIEDEDVLLKALNLYKMGFDFADAVHSLSSQHCVEFVTFDRRMANKAIEIEGVTIRELK